MAGEPGTASLWCRSLVFPTGTSPVPPDARPAVAAPNRFKTSRRSAMCGLLSRTSSKALRPMMTFTGFAAGRRSVVLPPVGVVDPKRVVHRPTRLAISPGPDRPARPAPGPIGLCRVHDDFLHSSLPRGFQCRDAPALRAKSSIVGSRLYNIARLPSRLSRGSRASKPLKQGRGEGPGPAARPARSGSRPRQERHRTARAAGPAVA